ncbi:hypothetical protein EJ110_NYTH41807 [Nymphaea thermarum]|nr:hypothetical protein EJ110_NYTH41807 [Nymphaea thermarum]
MSKETDGSSPQYSTIRLQPTMARSFALIAALMAMLTVVEFASIADAKHKSYLRVYEAPGCRRRSEEYNRCGCHNLRYNGGITSDYNEKDGRHSKIVLASIGF